MNLLLFNCQHNQIKDSTIRQQPHIPIGRPKLNGHFRISHICKCPKVVRLSRNRNDMPSQMETAHLFVINLNIQKKNQQPFNKHLCLLLSVMPNEAQIYTQTKPDIHKRRRQFKYLNVVKRSGGWIHNSWAVCIRVYSMVSECHQLGFSMRNESNICDVKLQGGQRVCVCVCVFMDWANYFAYRQLSVWIRFFGQTADNIEPMNCGLVCILCNYSGRRFYIN